MKQAEAIALVKQYLPPDRTQEVVEALSVPQTIERAVDDIARTITALTHQRTEIDLTISQLENIKAALTRLLPTDKRIDKLFD